MFIPRTEKTEPSTVAWVLHMTSSRLASWKLSGSISHRESFHYNLWPFERHASQPYEANVERVEGLTFVVVVVPFAPIPYLHAGAVARPPQRWFYGGPEVESRPSQSHCHSGSKGGSGPEQEDDKHSSVYSSGSQSRNYGPHQGPLREFQGIPSKIRIFILILI